ncbi:S41 family peptidase [Paenibacillus mesophilus]|uniref:S41 family peptidase n=1 Tax=Paenibacillus mesophilus TaxID=2582849 RepID=UPI00110D6A4E|nr:S41 family peptidase [Paenibacillus mesophilus]TMV51960.1 S41 family peptidase [Paenibacillus mesophilus]
MKHRLLAGIFNRLKAISVTLALLGLLHVPAGYASAETAQQFEEVQELLNQVHIGGKPAAGSEPGSIDELIKTLNDPYTDYFDEEEWAGFQNSLDLNYAGIGMRLGQDESGFIAVEIFRNSPAEAAGMQRGDYIVAIADKPIVGLRIDQVTALIRGAENTEIPMRVRRGDKEIDVLPVRGQIHLPVVSGGMMEGRVGYISIDSFSEGADEIFAATLTVLKQSDINGLVVDLRDNPGGILGTAQHIAEQFIPQGVLIHTRDKNNADDPVLIRNGQTVPFPVVLLVNENSASASEVLTAALQDYNKAIAVGTKTYGKGSVQALYELKTGGVLKVTVEEYLSPKKRVVNKIGVIPDIQTEGTVPQLLFGLRKAGAEQIKLEIERHLYRVNGFEFFDAGIPLVLADDSLCMPARVLAAAVGEPLEWSDSLNGVVIGKGASAVAFDASSGFLVAGATGFIELSRFKEKFPQTEWTSEPGKTVLTVKGKGMEWEK